MKSDIHLLIFSLWLAISSPRLQACSPSSGVQSVLLKVASISDELATTESLSQIKTAREHDQAISNFYGLLNSSQKIEATSQRSTEDALRFANPGGAHIDMFKKRVATYNSCVANNNAATQAEHNGLDANKKVLLRHLEDALGVSESENAKRSVITKTKQNETAFLAFISSFSVVALARIFFSDKK